MGDVVVKKAKRLGKARFGTSRKTPPGCSRPNLTEHGINLFGIFVKAKRAVVQLMQRNLALLVNFDFVHGDEYFEFGTTKITKTFGGKAIPDEYLGIWRFIK